MIPASYLFKDIYRQQWEREPLALAPTETRNPSGGVMTPLKAFLQALLHQGKPGRAYFGVHAYD